MDYPDKPGNDIVEGRMRKSDHKMVYYPAAGQSVRYWSGHCPGNAAFQL